jgi:hypothetical protein
VTVVFEPPRNAQWVLPRDRMTGVVKVTGFTDALDDTPSFK